MPVLFIWGLISIGQLRIIGVTGLLFPWINRIEFIIIELREKALPNECFIYDSGGQDKVQGSPPGRPARGQVIDH